MEEQRRKRAWEDLPPLALVNIFRRTDMIDRIWRAPFVCKSWNHAAHDPCVWSSIISDSISPEDVYIKSFYPLIDLFIYPFKGEQTLMNLDLGVSRLKTLIYRSGGGGEGEGEGEGKGKRVSSITSLCLFPFLSPDSRPFSAFPDEELIRTIGNSCPNLKHFSFHGSYHASKANIMDFISKCKKLELIDFSHSPYFIKPVIEQLGRSCPNLRGIRLAGGNYYSEALNLRKNLPQLKILNLGSTTLSSTEISALKFGSLEILHQDVTRVTHLTYELSNYRRVIARTQDRIYRIYDPGEDVLPEWGYEYQ